MQLSSIDTLRWSALMREADNVALRLGNTTDSFDPFHVGYDSLLIGTYIDRFVTSSGVYAGSTTVSYHDGKNPSGFDTMLTEGPNDTIDAKVVKVNDGVPWLPLLMMLVPFGSAIATVSEVAASSATAAVDGSSWVSGADLSTGGDISTGWVSGSDLPTGGDIGTSAWTSGADLPSGSSIASTASGVVKTASGLITPSLLTTVAKLFTPPKTGSVPGIDTPLYNPQNIAAQQAALSAAQQSQYMSWFLLGSAGLLVVALATTRKKRK